MSSEVGRELKVSELVPKTIVVLAKDGRPTMATMATMWVYSIQSEFVVFKFVVFTSGVLHTDFLAKRTGPDLEEITDDSGAPLKIYEYLGEV